MSLETGKQDTLGLKESLKLPPPLSPWEAIEDALLPLLVAARGDDTKVDEIVKLLDARVTVDLFAHQERLLAHLSNPSFKIRQQVVRCLASFAENLTSKSIDALGLKASPETEESIFVRKSAVTALGECKKIEALPYLLQAFTDPDLYLRQVVLPAALTCQGQNAEAAIPKLEELAKCVVPAVPIKEALKAIYSAVRQKNNEAIRYRKHLGIPLDPKDEHTDIAAHFANLRIYLPNLRDKFLAAESEFYFIPRHRQDEEYDVSSCHFKIFQGESGKKVICLIVDENSRCPAMYTNYEAIATALKHIYELEPEKCTWGFYQDRKSGDVLEDSLQSVSLTFNQQTQRYERPRYFIVSNANLLTFALREFNKDALK